MSSGQRLSTAPAGGPFAVRLIWDIDGVVDVVTTPDVGPYVTGP